MPAGHVVPSLPTPFHVKGWAPELTAPVALKAVWPFGAVIVIVAVAGWVELSIHVAWLLANCAVVPFTTTVAPTSESACVVCALCCSDTSVLSVLFGLHLLLDTGELDELLGELIGVHRTERILIL